MYFIPIYSYSLNYSISNYIFIEESHNLLINSRIAFNNFLK